MLFSWIWKKNSTGEGKAALTDIAWGRHSRRTQPTDGLRSHGTNRSRLRKPLNLGLPSLTGRLQLPTLQRPKPEGGMQETEPESGRGTARGFFLTRPEIRPTRGLNPRPQGATREPQTSGLRTFRLFSWIWLGYGMRIVHFSYSTLLSIPFFGLNFTPYLACMCHVCWDLIYLCLHPTTIWK
jgi:hypothetical protein